MAPRDASETRGALGAWLERRFELPAAGTNIRREVVAGLSTFATLSYILFVQPAVLGTTGMDPGGVLFATCVASAAACFLMALWANLPFALAPAMGHNFFFAFMVCGAMGVPWQQALAANLISGTIFLCLTPTRAREAVMEVLPAGLRAGIGAGIGLLIALLGLEWGDLVVSHPATYVQLGDLSSPVARLTLVGLALTLALHARGVAAALLFGMLGTALLGLVAGVIWDLDPALVTFTGLSSDLPRPTAAFALDFAGLFQRPFSEWFVIIALLLFLDLFDTVGCLLALGGQAGLLDRRGRLPRARGALAADAAGTVIGASLGTSTVTTYVESAAGIASGGRTGLVALVVGLCFLAALPLAPLFELLGAGVVIQSDPFPVTRYPVLAPALILIGALMASALGGIDWKDPVDAIPAFLTALIIPMGFSIADGIGWGLVAGSWLALVTRRRVSPLLHLLALLYLLRWLVAY